MRSLIITKPDKNQWDQMSSQLQNLPEELLVQVLGYLPKKDLKSARLTCSQIARTGAQWLFQRVYFAPRKSAIETFINISSNPVFARNVTELVYDARLFLSEFTHYESYKEAFDAFMVTQFPEDMDDVEHANEAYCRQIASVNWKSTDAEDYGESLFATMSRYLHLLDQQQRIFENKEDYEALCAGLKNLSNITTIIVLDNFFECCDWVVPLRIDEHSWYHQHSQREIAVPVPPVSWARDKTSDPDESNKWDVRGFQHLIRAVSQHGHNVVQLHIASESSSTAMSFFKMDQDICDDTCRMVRRLDLLKMGLSMSASDFEWRERKDRLNAILSEAKNLRCLALSGGIEINLLMNKVWPRLESLNLGDIAIEADELKAIIQAYQDTLRELSFRNIYISGAEGWADVAEEVGKYLRLRKIGILGVADDVTRELNGGPYLENKVSEAVARSFMQSIPRTTLLTGENQVTIFACPEESEDGKSHNP